MAWAFPDWQYREVINISGSSENLSDYQVCVDINSSWVTFWENVNVDGSDIRFTDAADTELYFWREEWNYTSQVAKIWTKVPSIPANETTTIYLYYGNPDASPTAYEDGEAVFEFFDDFEDGVIDSDKWTIDVSGDPSTTEENGVLKVGGGGPIGAVRCLETFSDYALEGAVRMTDTTVFDEWFIWIAYKDDDNHYLHRHGPGHPTLDQRHRLGKRVEGTDTVLDYVDYTTKDTIWHKFKAIVLDSGLKRIDFEDLPDLEADDTSLTSPFTFRLGGTSNSGHWAEYDYVLVRKYADPEPSIIGHSAEQAYKALDALTLTVLIGQIADSISAYASLMQGNLALDAAVGGAVMLPGKESLLAASQLLGEIQASINTLAALIRQSDTSFLSRASIEQLRLLASALSIVLMKERRLHANLQSVIELVGRTSMDASGELSKLLMSAALAHAKLVYSGTHYLAALATAALFKQNIADSMMALTALQETFDALCQAHLVLVLVGMASAQVSGSLIGEVKKALQASGLLQRLNRIEAVFSSSVLRAQFKKGIDAGAILELAGQMDAKTFAELLKPVAEDVYVKAAVLLEARKEHIAVMTHLSPSTILSILAAAELQGISSVSGMVTASIGESIRVTPRQYKLGVRLSPPGFVLSPSLSPLHLRIRLREV